MVTYALSCNAWVEQAITFLHYKPSLYSEHLVVEELTACWRRITGDQQFLLHNNGTKTSMSYKAIQSAHLD